MPTSVTRLAIRQYIHDESYAANFGLRRLRRGPNVYGLTELGFGATSITDIVLKETMVVANDFIGGWLRLSYTAAYDGTLTSTSVATLTDTAATWQTDEWIGLTVTHSGGATMVVTSNTGIKLSGSAGWTPSGSPGAGTYTISSAVRSTTHRITQFDPSAGTVVFSPAILTIDPLAPLGIVDPAMSWEIWPDTHPDFVDSSINSILSSLRFYSTLPVTMVPDGDMEDSATLGSSESFTAWWMTGTPTSAAKSTTSYPFPFGRQYISVVTGAAASRGVQSPTFPVDDAENLYVAQFVQKVPATTETSTYKVILYDVTNSTALKTVTVTGQVPVIVYFQQAPSATTEEVAIQVLSATSSTVSFRVGPCLVWSGQRSRYSLDTSSVVRASDVRELYTLPLGQQVESDVYLASRRLEPLSREIERDDRGNLINVVVPVPSNPIFMQAWQRWPELAADADTTYADKKTVGQGVLYYIEMARAGISEAADPQLTMFYASNHIRKAKTHLTAFKRMTGIPDVEFEEHISERTLVRFG